MSIFVTYEFKKVVDANKWMLNFPVAEDGIKLTLNADGCLTSKVFKSVENPAKIVLYEEWKTPEALAAYTASRVKSGYYKKWMGFNGKKWTLLKDGKITITPFTFVC